MRSTGEAETISAPSCSLYQVPDPELRQCLQPGLQHVVSRLVLPDIAPESQSRAINVGCPPTNTYRIYDTTYFPNVA
jgi:hypothetical protein